MTIVRRSAAWLVLGFAVSIGLVGCGGSGGDGQGHGSVEHVDVAARKITLDHGDIPGLMKGMTMTFEVGPGVGLEGIEPGAKIDFRVEEESGVYTVTEIRRSGS